MKENPILTTVLIVAIIIGAAALIKNWNRIFPSANGNYSGQRSGNDKVVCEYINERGQTITMEGYGEAFAQECKNKTRNDSIYRNNFNYFPYRWWYGGYPTTTYSYPWSSSFGVRTVGASA